MVTENSSQTWELWMVGYHQWDSICVLSSLIMSASVLLTLVALSICCCTSSLISSVDQIFF